MTHRGMTLLEVMLAMALLSAIVGVTASWMQIAGAAVTQTSEPARLVSAARAVLELIADDVHVGDFAKPTSNNNEEEPRRVEVSEGALIIKTRTPGSGPVEHQFSFDESAKRLLLKEVSSAGARERVLVVGVESASWQLDTERLQLTVQLVIDAQQSLSRRYSIE